MTDKLLTPKDEANHELALATTKLARATKLLDVLTGAEAKAFTAKIDAAIADMSAAASPGGAVTRNRGTDLKDRIDVAITGVRADVDNLAQAVTSIQGDIDAFG